MEWKCFSTGSPHFPDSFLVKTEVNDEIRINVNKAKGLLELIVHTNEGQKYKSVISNGVVIEERDINTGKSDYLDYIFNRYSRIISNLEDDYVIRIFGGNYGVSNNDGGGSGHHFSLNSNGGFFQNIIETLINKIVTYIQAMAQKPSLSDIFDLTVILSIGYTIFIINYDYLQAGLITAGAAIFSGYYDWLVRNKGPYILKIMCATIIGYWSVYIGIRYQ